MDNLINYNGNVLNSSEADLSLGNRGFSFGDGFFESILVIHGAIPLWSFHLERIIRSFEILQFNADRLLNNGFIRNQLFRIVPLQGIFRIKISFYRNCPGKYFPEGNDIQFIIHFNSAELPVLDSVKSMLAIGRAFQVQNAAQGRWKQVKSLSALPYVIAALEAKKSGYDDLLILTKEGLISESTNSNFFAIKENKIYTPSLETGCVNGVFREYLINLMRQNEIEILENELFWAEIESFDELFLTNAIQWIRPVSKVEGHLLGDNIHTKEIIQMVRKDLLQM